MATKTTRRNRNRRGYAIDFPEEGGAGRQLAHHGKRPVHRPEPRTAAIAQRGDEASVAVHGGAERPRAHPVSDAPGLDRPQKPGIEDAAGTWIPYAHPE